MTTKDLLQSLAKVQTEVAQMRSMYRTILMDIAKLKADQEIIKNFVGGIVETLIRDKKVRVVPGGMLEILLPKEEGR